MTDFENYFTAILDNKITACEKMKKVSEMLLNRTASSITISGRSDINDMGHV